MDWTTWYERWERQQEAYVAGRESRFQAMVQMLHTLPEDFIAIDLACGPGSFARRILAAFPKATVIAVDFDPVMLAMARAALPSAGGRLTVVEADLADPDWQARLGVTQVDAVVSTTAIHWLGATGMLQLYRNLATLIRPGGIFLNGDHMEFTSNQPVLAAAAKRVRNQHSARAFAAGAEGAERWWETLSAEPAAAEVVAEHERAFAGKERPAYDAGFALHSAALLDAGFREVGTIWQYFENRVLAAIR
jgi:trans-aconitate methyltransferase